VVDVRGSVRRRGPGHWEIRFELGYDPNGKRIRRFESVAGTRRDADRQLARRLHELETGTLVSPGKLTVAAFASRWLEDTRATVAPRTFERYEEVVRLHVVPELGMHRLSELRVAHIVRAQQAWREAALAPRTVLKIHRIVFKMLDDAVRWQLLSVNPCAAVRAPHVERREMTALSLEQARSLLDQVSGTEHGVMLATAIHTGLRLGELRGLRWVDVDLESGRLSVTQTLQRVDGELRVGVTKTHRSRRAVTLAPQMVALLRHHRRRQVEAHLAAGDAWEDRWGIVFTDALGRPVSDMAVRWALWRALQAAGLPRVRLHDLRHTAATLMLGQGVHPKIVSEMLGHSTVAVTLDLYSHVTPTMQREAADRLGALLDGPNRSS